jgi:hypothetical protein
MDKYLAIAGSGYGHLPQLKDLGPSSFKKLYYFHCVSPCVFHPAAKALQCAVHAPTMATFPPTPN